MAADKKGDIGRYLDRLGRYLKQEVAHQKYSVLLSHRKYALELLEETRLLKCKPTNRLMEANADLWFDDSHALDNLGRYMRLIGKQIYLTVTWPDITFVVGVLSRMHQPRETYWLASMRVLAYIKSYPGKGLVYRKHGHIRISEKFDSGYVGDRGARKSTTGCCTFVRENLVTWKSKK